MKTSKIIFLSLNISIALFILAAFVDIRLNGKKQIDTTELESHKTAIPEFRVLIIKNSVSLNILSKSNPSMELNMRKGVIPPEINYSVSHDTLTISDVPQRYNDEVLFLNVHFTDSLYSIIAEKSDITVRSGENCDISIEVDSSQVFISHTTTSKSDDNLIIHARNNSKIRTSTFRIDSLGVFIERSEASLSIQSNVLHGSASRGSMISTRQPLEISFLCDSTSKFLINDGIYLYKE
jgi:hypothetical protein